MNSGDLVRVVSFAMLVAACGGKETGTVWPNGVTTSCNSATSMMAITGTSDDPAYSSLWKRYGSGPVGVSAEVKWQSDANTNQLVVATRGATPDDERVLFIAAASGKQLSVGDYDIAENGTSIDEAAASFGMTINPCPTGSKPYGHFRIIELEESSDTPRPPDLRSTSLLRARVEFEQHCSGYGGFVAGCVSYVNQ